MYESYGIFNVNSPFHTSGCLILAESGVDADYAMDTTFGPIGINWFGCSSLEKYAPWKKTNEPVLTLMVKRFDEFEEKPKVVVMLKAGELMVWGDGD